MKEKLIFIGPIDVGHTPKGGDSMKNQLFLSRFKEVFAEIVVVDTCDWKHRPSIFFKLIRVLLFKRNYKIIVSANPGSADTIIRIIKKIQFNRDVFYWVVGGSFHTMIINRRFNFENYVYLKGIFVQGKSMELSLKKNGLDNAIYVPNSKIINYIPKKTEISDEKFHFVFLSRIDKSKGCDYIFKSIDILNEYGYCGKYDVSFYGNMTNDKEYADSFMQSINSHQETKYYGLLDLRKIENYDKLAKCDVMLFPTYWHGEGFPGVIIDAYIASLPIITTDWNLNKDIVEDGKTGWIIPVHDVNALVDRMKYCIDHPQEIRKLALNCQRQSMKYDSRSVLSKENLVELGLL